MWLAFWRRRKEQRRVYRLMRVTRRGVADTGLVFDYPVEPEEVKSMGLPRGRYILQEAVEGGRIVKGNVWGEPVEIEESPMGEEEVEMMKRVEEGEETESDRLARTIERDFERAIRWFRLPEIIKEAAKKVIGIEPVFGGGSAKGELEHAIEIMKKYKNEIEEIAGIFGYTKGEAKAGRPEEIPVQGSLSAWAVYGPRLVRETLRGIREEVREFMKDLSGEVEKEVEKLPRIPELE